MFFRLVRKNGRKTRRENGIFFVSLIVSIIAFYIFLSLENQDVIVFLKKMCIRDRGTSFRTLSCWTILPGRRIS